MKHSVFTVGGRIRLLKTLHNVRVTLLCGLLTFIVLRSSLGAGKFGTPVQDFDEIQHQLHRFKLRRQQKLRVIRERLDTTIRKDTSRSTLSLPTEGSRADNAARAYAFDNRAGFPDWFEQKHLPTQSRVLLVTKRPSFCKNVIAAQFLLRFLENKIDYCRMHGIEIVYDAEAANTSASARALEELMLSHWKVEWIWWMDSFTMFTEMAPPRFAAYAGYNVVCGAGGAFLSNNRVQKSWEKIWNGGSFLLRNCNWSRNFLRSEGQMRVGGELFVDTKMATYEPGVRYSQARPLSVIQFSSCDLCGDHSIDPGCLTHMERAIHVAERQKMQAEVSIAG